MPDIIFRLSNGVGQPPTVSLNIAPTRRFVNNTEVILPDNVDIPVFQDPTIITLLPSGPDWCWRISEKSNHLSVRYVVVPDVLGPIEYVDLQNVDPISFTPLAIPDPLWVTQLETKLAVPNGAIQPMRMIGYGSVVPADNTGQKGDLFIQTP